MQKALVSYVSWWHFYYFTYAGDTLCAGDTLEPPVPTAHGSAVKQKLSSQWSEEGAPRAPPMSGYVLLLVVPATGPRSGLSSLR